MSILNLENICKAFGEKVILDGVTAAIEEGEKIGVVGINGAGKSTLLSVIAGTSGPDSGSIVMKRGLRLSYLCQNPVFREELSVLENVTAAIRGKESHWDTEGEARTLLLRSGIPDPDCSPSVLSGGQRKRAALIAALLTPCDLLILDEPTNHLDHEMIEWLGERIAAFPGALLLVTHDRYFLDESAERIWELDRCRLYPYEGSYTDYLEKRQERLDFAAAAERKMAALYRQDLKWMLRGARARSTKQKAHIRRFEALRDREKLVEERQAVISSLPSRLGRTVIELDGISKGYGTGPLFRDLTYTFTKTERLGIIGKNGCGKSTLLRCITGRELPDTGSVTVGQTVRFGIFSQETEIPDETERVIDCVRDVAEVVRTPDGTITASAMCERFLFDPKLQYTRVSKLSGGEKRRLFLLRVLMSSPNVLVLDEPTNDLDIQTLQILEEYLDTFNGVIIAVSHDRYFLDRVVTRLLVFEDGGTIRRSEGAYTEYLEHLKEDSGSSSVSGSSRAAAASKPSCPVHSEAETQKTERTGHRTKKLSYSEQREYDGLEQEIDLLSTETEKLDTEIAAAASDYVRLRELTEKKEALEQDLEVKMERFFELQEKAEALKNT